jgi:hypothetical protein
VRDLIAQLNADCLFLLQEATRSDFLLMHHETKGHFGTVITKLRESKGDEDSKAISALSSDIKKFVEHFNSVEHRMISRGLIDARALNAAVEAARQNDETSKKIAAMTASIEQLKLDDL